MDDVTPLEKITSNVAIKGAANTIAILGATITPLAAFVPFLVDTLASGRQGERLERMFAELNAITAAHSKKFKELSDDQYKVVNEAISAAFYTINQDKLDLLKRAAANALLDGEAVSQVSDALSRAIRDMSAAEAAFITQNFKYEMFIVTDDTEVMKGAMAIRPRSEEEIMLSGLINLGLLYSKAPRWDIVAFEWSPLVVKLIRLIKYV
jgi:hypothetical protein